MNFFFDTEFNASGMLIEPLSIGIISADGREFYAEYESDGRNDSKWVRSNVRPHMTGRQLSNPAIANCIIDFVAPNMPSFWADFCAYDWVVFCQTFGGFMYLPKSFPQYCNEFRTACESPPAVNFSGQEHNALDDARHLRKMFLAASVRAA